MTYFSKAKIITNTSVHTGSFKKITALEDTVIHTLGSEVLTGTSTSITLNSNVSLEFDIRPYQGLALPLAPFASILLSIAPALLTRVSAGAFHTQSQPFLL